MIEMWSNVMNKLKQGALFKKNRAKLTNVSIGYDNKLEINNTHPDLLPKEDSLGPTETQMYNVGLVELN